MAKCINRCQDPAESNYTWWTSKGCMSVNLCGICATDWWNKFKNTPAGHGLTIRGPLSNKELAERCKEYHQTPPVK